MRSPEDVIKRPYVTEKSNGQMVEDKYTFIVDVRATKIEIRNAVEKIFGVKVLNVNTMNYNGKKKRTGVHQGYRADWKKAVVKIDSDPKDTRRKYKKNIEEFGVAQ